jgi:hypothetical protein
MKKITLYLNDETIETFRKVAKMDIYVKYPSYQAYGLFIDDLVREVQKLSFCPSICCCVVPEHNHPPVWLWEEVQDK